jgi:hypothetical protein
MPARAVINRFRDIKLDRAGDVKGAGGRRLRQRHRIAKDIAGLLEGCERRFRKGVRSGINDGGGRNCARPQENIVGACVA